MSASLKKDEANISLISSSHDADERVGFWGIINSISASKSIQLSGTFPISHVSSILPLSSLGYTPLI